MIGELIGDRSYYPGQHTEIDVAELLGGIAQDRVVRYSDAHSKDYKCQVVPEVSSFDLQDSIPLSTTMLHRGSTLV
jgi:hypothetical protein